MIFSLAVLAVSSTIGFISANHNIVNAINNSDISKLNSLLLDNKSEIKNEDLEKYIILANQVVEKSRKNVNIIDNNFVGRLFNGAGALYLAVFTSAFIYMIRKPWLFKARDEWSSFNEKIEQR